MINHASFVPVEGQSFSSEQDWINRATKALTDHPEYRDTQHPKKKGWQGRHFTTMCFDQKGRRCWNGADFSRATKEGTYPIWWIWPDQIATAMMKATAEAVVLENALAEAGSDFRLIALHREATPKIETMAKLGEKTIRVALEQKP